MFENAADALTQSIKKHQNDSLVWPPAFPNEKHTILTPMMNVRHRTQLVNLPVFWQHFESLNEKQINLNEDPS